MLAGKPLGERVGFCIDDEVNPALPVQRHFLGSVFGNGRKTHGFETFAKCCRIWGRVLDQLKSVGSNWVVPRLELQVVS